MRRTPCVLQLCTYTHTYIHTYIHACIHTVNAKDSMRATALYIHSYTHTYIHAYIHTYSKCEGLNECYSFDVGGESWVCVCLYLCTCMERLPLFACMFVLYVYVCMYCTDLMWAARAGYVYACTYIHAWRMCMYMYVAYVYDCIDTCI